MEHQMMLRTAIVLLALTGAGGLLMAGIRFSGKPHPPTWFAMGHGLLAASGLTLLVYAALTRGMPQLAWIGLLLLVVAALGGMILNLRYHWKHEALPIGFMLGHAGAAVLGLVLVALGGWSVTSA